jgi:hypothetical protein
MAMPDQDLNTGTCAVGCGFAVNAFSGAKGSKEAEPLGARAATGFPPPSSTAVGVPQASTLVCQWDRAQLQRSAISTIGKPCGLAYVESNVGMSRIS